jgi:excisionase family DNA binding protein
MHLEVAQALSLKATATALSISPRTVHRLIDEKGLPSIRIGRRRLVRRDDLRAWLMSRETVKK